MVHLTTSILTNAAATLPSQFDSHAVIRVLIQHNATEYNAELARYSGQDPVRQLHSDIGRALYNVPNIQGLYKVHSQNVRGNTTPNHLWQQ